MKTFNLWHKQSGNYIAMMTASDLQEAKILASSITGIEVRFLAGEEYRTLEQRIEDLENAVLVLQEAVRNVGNR